MFGAIILNFVIFCIFLINSRGRRRNIWFYLLVHLRRCPDMTSSAKGGRWVQWRMMTESEKRNIKSHVINQTKYFHSKIKKMIQKIMLSMKTFAANFRNIVSMLISLARKKNRYVSSTSIQKAGNLEQLKIWIWFYVMSMKYNSKEECKSTIICTFCIDVLLAYLFFVKLCDFVFHTK